VRRRHLLAAATGAALAPPRLPAPAVAQGTRATTLRFIPQANLAALDPVWTTATVTGNHGYNVFDTLYAVDNANRPRPQMAEGHETLDDGRRWRFRLRDGLRFHDDEPVRARDCVASIRRWCVRDPFGQLLARAVAEWVVVDDRTFEARLHRPFPLILDALAKPDAAVCFMMPERLANTDPNRAITEMIGSGPYRFVAAEYNSGARVAYERFDAYVPRGEPPERASGAKIAHMRRIEWNIVTDPSTAAAALVNGEADWWERPLSDLAPVLARSRDVRREILDKEGRLALLRLNCLQPPFDDVRMRRAVRLAVNQEDTMRAAQGDDQALWSACRSLFPQRTPYYRDNPDLMPASLDACRAAMRDAGYAGGRIVVINPTDFPDIGPLGQVTADTLKRAGMNIDLAESDWGTVIQRRNSREPVERGGWSLFHTTGSSNTYASPAMSPLIRGQGDAGWFGWWKSERAEELTAEWIDAPDEGARARLAGELGRLALEEVATVPLGQFTIRTAFRRDLGGFIEGSIPYPWNVRRG